MNTSPLTSLLVAFILAAAAAHAQVSAQPQPVGPSITDRAAWEEAAKLPVFRDAVAEAERELAKALVVVSDDDYLEYSRTGSRARHTAARNARSARLKALVLGECVENRGRFLAGIEEVLRSTCAEKTWTDNAHDRQLKNFKGTGVEIDLEVAKTGFAVATAVALLGEKLTAPTSELALRELERRVFTPFRAALRGEDKRAAYWLNGSNNWVAICLAGVAGAAQSVLPSAEDRALLIDAAAKYSANYLRGSTTRATASRGSGIGTTASSTTRCSRRSSRARPRGA